jgi:hypothetical protein
LHHRHGRGALIRQRHRRPQHRRSSLDRSGQIALHPSRPPSQTLSGQGVKRTRIMRRTYPNRQVSTHICRVLRTCRESAFDIFGCTRPYTRMPRADANRPRVDFPRTLFPLTDCRLFRLHVLCSANYVRIILPRACAGPHQAARSIPRFVTMTGTEFRTRDRKFAPEGSLLLKTCRRQGNRIGLRAAARSPQATENMFLANISQWQLRIHKSRWDLAAESTSGRPGGLASQWAA